MIANFVLSAGKARCLEIEFVTDDQPPTISLLDLFGPAQRFHLTALFGQAESPFRGTERMLPHPSASQQAESFSSGHQQPAARTLQTGQVGRGDSRHR